MINFSNSFLSLSRRVDNRVTRIGARANRGKTAANATSVRALGAGVMNNNPLLLPGRAINTQLANAHPSRAAIRFVTHSHDICFRAWSARGPLRMPSHQRISASLLPAVCIVTFRQSSLSGHSFGSIRESYVYTLLFRCSL